MCFVLVGVRVIKTCTMFCARICREYVQPIAHRVAQNLEIISKTLATYQNSAHGMNDEHQVIAWC